ncbi:YceI family protein, partial [Mycolicibacterium agri]
TMHHGPTNPWSESNSSSLRRIQGDSTIDVASITSPESARDGQFRGEDIMDVARYPTAEFKSTEPVDLSAVPESGEAVSVDVPGAMTIKGTTRDVVARVNVKRAGDTVIATASVPVTWTDFGVTPPDFAGFVTVQPTGTIETLVNLAKK